ncbi:hypothetical protein IU469_22015 [Nocardia puris]|uniref:hypothetical protein n=1 Tax=Nocardia puris TaxID=208602 RepID=UPI0018942F16|nr:hypothetical protein [Nocardia puris]MBF6368375.1 hypothetical protein [Nocardia puris]
MSLDIRSSQQQLHAQLLEIRAARGQLTPQDVVDTARDSSHPLHHRFEWDDATAGEAYRRIQAAELIRSVRLVYAESPEGEPRSVRGWSTLPGSTGYKPTEEVAADPFAAKLLLREAEREFRAFQRKYGHLREFADMVLTQVQGGAA